MGIVESVEDMTDAEADAGADRPGARDRPPQALRRASAVSIRAENAHLDIQLALMPNDNPYAYMLNSNGEAADALEQGPDQAKLEAAMGGLPGLAKRRNDLRQARLESVGR